MCIILDSDAFGKFMDQNDQDMQPVRNWLQKKKGKIVYSNTDKLKREWKSEGMRKQIRDLARREKLKLIDHQEVQEKENVLKGKIVSNDEHVIALAIIANVKVLVSGGDKKLHADFKNSELVGGKVYQQAKHKHLLTENTCP